MQQTGQPVAEKGLLRLHGRPLVAWAVDAMPAGLQQIYISANRHIDEYAEYGDVVSDNTALGHDIGPLAGLASVMQIMSTQWVYVAPADVPRPPATVLSSLVRHVFRHGIHLAYVRTDRPQPLFMLVNKSLQENLESYIHHGGRQVQEWQREHGQAVYIDGGTESFFNVNTPDELRRAHELIAPMRS